MASRRRCTASLAKFRLSYALLMNEGTNDLKGDDAAAPVTVDGKRLASVRLEVPHADPIDVDIDPDSGAYVGRSIDPGGDHETTVRILSYTDVLPGKKMIGSFRIGDDAAERTAYTKIEPNVTDSR